MQLGLHFEAIALAATLFCEEGLRNSLLRRVERLLNFYEFGN